MATEKLTLVRGYGKKAEWRDFEIEYREIDHWLPHETTRRGRKLKRYEVLVDGERLGTVESNEHTSSTTYKGTRIRRDLGRPVRWSWEIDTNSRTFPGLYSDTRRTATVEMLNRKLGTFGYGADEWRKPWSQEERPKTKGGRR